LSFAASGAADAGAFLSRLVRVDQGAVVRLRPDGSDRVALWARLPWDVLVTRTVAGSVGRDSTVDAGALLAAVAEGRAVLPPRRDEQWRWPLPPSGGAVVESLPATQLRVLGVAAERTVREAAGSLGERLLRDAVLDHVAIVIENDMSKATVEIDQRVEVPQRLVQAVVRMGFVRAVASDDEPTVRVLTAGRFVGLAAEYGVAWYGRTGRLSIQAIVRTDEAR
jgi:hypothetical protein